MNFVLFLCTSLFIKSQVTYKDGLLYCSKLVVHNMKYAHLN